MKKVAKNLFYQIVFQITKIILPIITIPIVSSALGPKGIGLYNYTYSIAQYFMLAAGLGVTIYGNREIALVWNKQRKKTSKIFWEIFFFKTIITLFVLICYFIFIYFTYNKVYFFAQSMIIISVLFDISWFFMGIEDFKKTSMVSLLVQLLTFVGILLFVKNSNDTFTYTVIQSGGIFLSQLLVWLFLGKKIKWHPVNINGIFRHFKGALEFFIPQVAILLYTNLNKTVLGLFLGNTAVGYFTNSLQLNSVFITVITTLDIVLLPHMTSLFASNNINKIVRTMEKTIHLQLYTSVPIMFGMLTVYDKLVPWFFGDKFLFINKVIPFFSVLIVIIPIGMAISRQYLMPVGKVSEYNKSVIVGAVINILSNVILLPIIGFFGVVISYILAEFFVALVRIRSFLKTTDFGFKIYKIVIFLISGLVMCLLTRYFTRNFNPSIFTNMIQLCIAVPIYIILTTLFKANPLLEIVRSKK
ncbi:oligosaccharide flippase family protein [Enterococcus avium]|uniref:oligosaccharide flippase family protein n=1 Tax=Enterococcus avium TaxID=33945 RepID=UPI003DA284CF